MKKILILLIVISLFADDYMQSSLKINGESQHIYIKKSYNSNANQSMSINSSENKSTQNIVYETKTGMSFHNNSDLLIKFINNLNKNQLSEFENRYNLVFKKKLHIGYYIFINNNQDDILDLINTIIIDNKNIKTIKPNWNLNLSLI